MRWSWSGGGIGRRRVRSTTFSADATFEDDSVTATEIIEAEDVDEISPILDAWGNPITKPRLKFGFVP